MATPHEFKTTDTALAAFLVTSHIVLSDIEIGSHPVQFIFTVNGRLTELLSAWESGEAIGNIPSFFRQYRKFIDTIKRGDIGNNG